MTVRPPSSRRLARTAAAVYVGALLTLLSVLGPAGRAQAHSELTSSTPADQAQLTAAPAQVTLVFNQQINPNFVALSLSVGSGPVTPLSPQVSGPRVTGSLSSAPGTANVAAESWRVAYRVVAADGHPITGTVSFTVTSATTSSTPTTTGPSPIPTPPLGPSSAAPTIAATTQGSQDLPGSRGGSLGPLMLVVAALALVTAAVGARVWSRKRRNQ